MPRMPANGARIVLRSIAARASQLHDLLAHAAVALAVRVLQIADDEHGIAIRRVIDRRGGEGDDGLTGAEMQPRLDEHPRAQHAAGIRQRCLHLDVARRLVDDRIHRGHAAGELPRAELACRDVNL